MISSRVSVSDQTYAAKFSPCRKYRYMWMCTWGDDRFAEHIPAVMFIGLNPSRADEKSKDPTVTRCINFAKAWGFERILMTNLFAWIDTDPKGMLAAADPVGVVENNSILVRCAASVIKHGGVVVAAWGTQGFHMDRDRDVLDLFHKQEIHDLKCLKLTKHGYPQHPLYLSANSKLMPYKQRPYT